MHDAVAEVLRERKYLDPGFSSGLLLSILLHGAIVAALFISTIRPEQSADPPVRVRLAGPQQPSQVQKPAAPAPAPALAEPVRPTPPPPAEKPPEATPRPETKQVEKSLFGESPEKPVDRKAEDRERAAPSKKPPQEAVPATPPPANATGTEGTGTGAGISVGAGSAQISGLEGGDFPYTFYVERMLGIIGGNWFRPDSGAGAGVTIHFVIQRNGTVRDVEITQSSGNAAFDRAARRAVMESSPLPPLPFQYTGTELGVHLKFN